MADELEEMLREEVLAGMDASREPEDQEILERIDTVLLREGRRSRLSVAERAAYRKKLFDSFRRLDVLQELIEDRSVTEIMVNGRSHIFLERDGHVEPCRLRFSSQEKLEDVIQQIVSRVNRVVNTASPIVDARLEDGSRVNVVLPPVAPDGPILTVRKFPAEPVTMEDLIRWGSITPEAAEVLKILVRCGYNIFISGGTGTGKTTFLNALSRFIPPEERVITIEDSLELQLSGIPNLVRMETRNAGADGQGAITIRDLLRTALRMRPDRIVIGEVRGAEAMDLLQAFNTGHDGSLSSAHANSPADMLSRLETMVLMGGELPLPAIRQQIASAVEILVHLGRLRGGARKVLSVVEVLGYENGEINWQTLFSYDRAAGKLLPAGHLLCRDRKLKAEQDEDGERRLQEILSVADGVDEICPAGVGGGGGSGLAVLPQPDGFCHPESDECAAAAADAKDVGEAPQGKAGGAVS